MRTAVTLVVLTIATTLALAADRPRKNSPANANADGQRKTAAAPANRDQVATKMALENEAALKSQYLDYVGTKITTDPKVKLPAAVTKMLTTADWKSPARLAYFDWLKTVPNLRCNGWNGAITKANAIEGGYVINVAFTPILASPEGGHVLTPRIFHEVYEVSAQGLNFVSGSGNSAPRCCSRIEDEIPAELCRGGGLPRDVAAPFAFRVSAFDPSHLIVRCTRESPDAPGADFVASRDLACVPFAVEHAGRGCAGLGPPVERLITPILGPSPRFDGRGPSR